ncbi:MAG: hypothetical protein LBC86_09425 [Oscillospiraceae bacterium]|jgi:hypothetical protein|nr:hypothetical protein [Oscillospiraceae bacterium]
MKGHIENMKKFVLCLFAAFAAFTLATGASAVTGTNSSRGGVIGATENIVGGAVEGAENIAGGVVRGAENIAGGTHGNRTHGNHTTHGNHVTHGNHRVDDNKDGVHPIPHGHESAARNEHARGNNVHNPRDDRNPSTAVGFGIVEMATIGVTMLGTAAIAGGKKRR